MGSRGRIKGGDTLRITLNPQEVDWDAVRESMNRRVEDNVSDVDSHTTPMSDEDREQVGGSDWGTRYFQSSTSFEINEALRNVAENGGDLNEALIDAGVWQDNLLGVNKTIEAMDRNMQPINKDMNVVRLVDDDYTDKVFSSLGVSNEVLSKIGDIRFFGKFSDADVKEISDKLVGARVTESGFMSSTYNLSLDDSAFTMRSVKLDFDVPQNTRGMFSPTGSESEFVFARGTKYEFTNVSFDPDDRRLVLKVKIVK